VRLNTSRDVVIDNVLEQSNECHSTTSAGG
jgi:hypothetical protein